MACLGFSTVTAVADDDDAALNRFKEAGAAAIYFIHGCWRLRHHDTQCSIDIKGLEFTHLLCILLQS